MTETTTGRGLEIPFGTGFDFRAGLPAKTWRFLALLLPCVLASIIAGAKSPGSIAAFCFVIPLIPVAVDLWPRRVEPRVLVQMALTLGAMLGVALEPGVLNITLSWVLLVALAVEARSVGVHAPLAALGASLQSIVAAPFAIMFESIAGLTRLPVKPRQVAKLPITSLFLPLLAIVVFAQLLATANPIFASLISVFDLSDPLRWLDTMMAYIFSFEATVFAAMLIMLWPVLRGHATARASSAIEETNSPLWHRLFFKPLAVTLTLLALNAMFALENLLDIQHLWLSPLAPGSYAHADYVHRGAYTLIVTATLAGLLMLTALRKGTATETTPLVRFLTYVFAAQNLLLVLSSVQRTLLYIDDYGWTEWRLSGLAWMALVFFGLATIFWRVAKNRDSRWLINTNIIAATVLLVGFSIWNMQGFIAQKNVERSLANPALALDVDYLMSFGGNALPALRFYRDSLLKDSSPILPNSANPSVERVRWAISNCDNIVLGQQRDPRRWTLRHVGLVTGNNL